MISKVFFSGRQELRNSFGATLIYRRILSMISPPLKGSGSFERPSLAPTKICAFVINYIIKYGREVYK